MKKNMFYTAAVLLAGAVMAACSGSEDITSNTTPEPQTSAQQGVVELSGTIGGKGAMTRTIASDGKGSWAVGDQFAIYYQTTSGHSTAVATINSVNESNGSANFKVSLYYPKTGESNVTLIYPASAHNGNGGIKTDALAEQDGTLAGINNNGLDIETATTGLTVEEQAGKYSKATLNSDVQMQPQVCLYKLTLKKKSTNTNLSAKKLEISDGTHNYTVTPAYATSSFTVALLPANGADFTFAATTKESGRVYTKQAVTLGTCTSANVGHVFDKDGNIYEVSNGPGVIYGKSFSNKTLESGNFYTQDLTLEAGGGITPVAMIAYVGDGSANSIETGRDDLHGLAIAMQDCSSSNTGTGNWSGSTKTTWCTQNSATCTSHSSTNVTVARGWKDGISMTSTLASATEHTHYAAKGAANYQYDTSNPSAALPSDCSGWFLPSLGQWQLIIQGLVSKKKGEAYTTPITNYSSNNKYMTSDYLNSILTNAGAAGLQPSDYWSSEYSSLGAWNVYFLTGYASNGSKTNNYYVRAVLAF